MCVVYVFLFFWSLNFPTYIFQFSFTSINFGSAVAAARYFTFMLFVIRARTHARTSSISNAVSHSHLLRLTQLIYRHDIKSNGGGGGGVDMTVSHLFNVIALCVCAVGKWEKSFMCLSMPFFLVSTTLSKYQHNNKGRRYQNAPSPL